jgi:hypothetical protein
MADKDVPATAKVKILYAMTGNPAARVFKGNEIFLPEINLKKEAAKTSFLPHLSNVTALLVFQSG